MLAPTAFRKVAIRAGRASHLVPGCPLSIMVRETACVVIRAPRTDFRRSRYYEPVPGSPGVSREQAAKGGLRQEQATRLLLRERSGQDAAAATETAGPQSAPVRGLIAPARTGPAARGRRATASSGGRRARGPAASDASARTLPAPAPTTARTARPPAETLPRGIPVSSTPSPPVNGVICGHPVPLPAVSATQRCGAQTPGGRNGRPTRTGRFTVIDSADHTTVRVG